MSIEELASEVTYQFRPISPSRPSELDLDQLGLEGEKESFDEEVTLEELEGKEFSFSALESTSFNRRIEEASR